MYFGTWSTQLLMECKQLRIHLFCEYSAPRKWSLLKRVMRRFGLPHYLNTFLSNIFEFPDARIINYDSTFPVSDIVTFFKSMKYWNLFRPVSYYYVAGMCTLYANIGNISLQVNAKFLFSGNFWDNSLDHWPIL